MEKYCPKCRQKRNSRSKFCDMCGTPLEEREGRIKLPKGMYDKVYRRDGYRCQMCGASKNNGAELTIDHIIPLAAGGSNSIDNLQTLCHSCNENKADLIFKSGLDVDIEIKKNELKSLLRVISEKREKFKSLTNLLSKEKEILSNCNEDEKIDIIFNIKQLEEEFIPTIESDLKKLNKELQLIEEDLRLKILE
ncbi:MAG: HNH endonuclease, partial [Methanobrevibacter sp.]|nr:HNH endonuclease [Methanobrevibacter sp.]